MKKNSIIVGFLVLAVVAVVGIKNKNQGSSGTASCANGLCTFPVSEAQPRSEDVKDVPSAEKALPALLELGSINCVPCKMMAPMLNELRDTFNGQFDVNVIDVWKDEVVGKKHNILAIPTQIFFDAEGKELFRHEGFYPREDIVSKWDELGYDFTESQVDNQ